MSQDPSHSTPLPESLRKQLDEFRQQLWRAKIAEAVFAGIFGLLLSYLLVFALDRVWPTPGIVRLIILLAGTSLTVVFAPIWLHRWVWRHRQENQLAKLICQRHPGLGDRLLGVVELQEQSEDADSLSPRLRAAAMEAVAAETQRRKLEDSLPISRHRRWSLAVIALFLVAGAALTLVPKAGLNSLKRWLFPLSTTPRYTFTVLEEVPAQLPVPQGEAFAIDLYLAADSEWHPDNGTARYSRQDPVWSQLSGKTYHFEFPGQQEEGIVKIEIGDARHRIKVIPSLRPTINRKIAQIHYPEYLELGNRTLDLATGSITVVEGSKVQLSIESSRSLDSATFGPVVNADPIEAPLLEPGIEGPMPFPEPAVVLETADMTVRGAMADTGFIPVATSALSVPMNWTDGIGLSGAEGFSIRIDSTPDEAPITYIQGIASQKVILPGDTVEFEVSAEDDFGIKEYGLEWQGELTTPGDEAPAKGELILEKGAPNLARSSMPAAFSPAAFEIGPQKLILRAYAEDYLSERGRVYSQPITLHILSLEEHSQMLKNQFDRAISELEDLSRKERNLYEENQRLERLEAEELRDEDAKKRLEEQQNAEAQQAEKMKELTEKMEELLKESARNETIDKDTLKKMAESIQSMSELGEQDMPEVEAELGEAQDQRNTDEKSKEDVKEAVEKQKKVLEKMEETIKKANEAKEQFEASTFIARLKKAASDEDNVASAAIDSSEHFGLYKSQLDPAVLGILMETIRGQSNTATDVRWIQEDLGHFFTRTDKQIYRDILDAMTEEEIDIGLEGIRLQLNKNHGSIAITEARKWAEKLREWAKLLEGAKDDDGGGGGGGGGGGQEDEDFEFMLRVMRLIQQEQEVRANTRALETLRRSYELNSQP